VVFGTPSGVISAGTPSGDRAGEHRAHAGRDPDRGFSVKFTLSPNLTLTSGPASVTEGTYLNSAGRRRTTSPTTAAARTPWTT
jgi:hypothetical protein